MNSEKPALILERDGPVAIIINNDAPINRMTLDFIDALAVERRAVHKAATGKHQMEGMMAFLEKRTPDFSTDPE
jgi:hypothetical protein